MGRKRILVTQDDELLSIFRESSVLSRGVDLLFAGSGREAFSLIEEQDPDLVFLSPDLDELSGVECCELVKNDPILKVTPIVAVLPQGRSDSLTDCCRELFDDLLSKPIEPQRLLSLVCKYLGICERPNRRRLIQLPVHFFTKGHRRHGLTQDISGGGLFIETKHLVPVDTQFDLEIDLPGQEAELCCRVRVAWVNHPEWMKKNDFPCGMGLAFVNSSAESLALLEDFIRRE